MRISLAIAVCLLAQQAISGQTPFSLPAWLANYPGVDADIKTFPAMAQSTYTTPAKPDAVSDHYRKLIETQNLPFHPSFDGVGTVIRAGAEDYDLLITIRKQDSGTLVRVSCAAKSPEYVAVPGSDPAPGRPGKVSPGKLSPKSQEEHDRMVAEGLERHKKMVAELGIHPVYQDAPAPPLEWPIWLAHPRGAKLALVKGVDQSHRDYLKSNFATSIPMTEVFAFYEDLLNAHDYHVYSSKLGTGQTLSGVMQNADGYVEGANYPQGHPGPETIIRVSFSRFYLNEPIKVEVRFTTHAFEAPKRRF